MLVPTLRQHLPQTLALRGAPFLALRTFSLTAPALTTAKVVTTRESKASATPPPQKIAKKDLKTPFKFPGTPWTNFMREHTKANPGRVPENGKLASEKWAQLSQEEKDKYAVPKEVLEEYYAKRREWRASLPTAMRKKLLTKTKVPGQINTYPLFVRENYDKSISFKENSQALKIKWSNLSEAEKQAYAERAQEEKKAAANAQAN